MLINCQNAINRFLLHSHQFKKVIEIKKHEILNNYLANTNRIKNWSLADLSSYKIVGEWLKNRDEAVIRYFLDKHAGVIPRTMLRYSIEKL